jgi:assimilatory nitrate reductase catalytic subunit
MVAMRRCDQPGRLERIRDLLESFEYASCGLYGRDPGIVVLRAAHTQAPEQSLIEHMEVLLDMADDSQTISYQDTKRGISKRIVVENGEVVGLRLLGETLAANWLKDVMVQGKLTDELRRWALAPLSVPPSGGKNRGGIVCNCLDVSELEIQAVLAEGADLSALQQKLKCGTECGSCVPELKRIVSGFSPSKN